MEKVLKELVLALKSIANALMGKVNSSNNDNEEGEILPFTLTDSPKWVCQSPGKEDNDYIDINELEDYIINNENFNTETFYFIYDHKPDKYNFNTIDISGPEAQAYLSTYDEALSIEEIEPGKWVIYRGG